jgi:hypothetical protein
MECFFCDAVEREDNSLERMYVESLRSEEIVCEKCIRGE